MNQRAGIYVCPYLMKGAFMNLYGELIRKLRQDNNITQEELANILLITPEKMTQVEAGQELLTDSELTLCANVLDASSAALKNGVSRAYGESSEISGFLQGCSEVGSSYFRYAAGD